MLGRSGLPTWLRGRAHADATAPVVASALVVSMCLAVSAGCTASKPGSEPATQGVTRGVGQITRLWLTTRNGHLRLADRGPVPSAPQGAADADVTVEDQPAQQFFGVGASLTGSSAEVLNALAPARREQVMRDVFTRGRGIGLSVLRQPVGANDFSVGNRTYDDVDPGASDPGLSHFELGPDRTEIVPLLQRAAELNPSLAVVLSPWSAPPWMKTTGSVVGGTLRPEAMQPYADYLVRAAQEYLHAGVPVTGLTAQNEPSYSPPAYPGMVLDVEQRRTLLRDHLRPALDRAGLPLHLWALDDNFDRWPDADALLSDPATRAATYGVAFHCYHGNVSALQEIRRRHPGVAVAVSECSGGTWSGGFAVDLRYEAKTLLVDAIRNGALWLAKWNLVLDPNGGPQNGGCRNCRGLVTVDPSTGAVTHSAAYYVWGHVGRFVIPGARVVRSSSRARSGLDSVAFRNRDGSHVLVVYNGGRGQEVTIDTGDRSFAARIPAGALATVTW